MSSVRLPLETTSLSLGTHDLHMVIQTSVVELSRSMDNQAMMDFETTYDMATAPNSMEANLNFRSMGDAADVEERLKEVVDSNMEDVEVVYTMHDRTKGKGKAV